MTETEKEIRLEFGGIAFDTPDNSTFYSMRQKFSDFIGKLSLHDDQLKAIKTGKEWNLMGVLNRNTGECVLTKEYLENQNVLIFLSNQFRNKYQKELRIINL